MATAANKTPKRTARTPAADKAAEQTAAKAVATDPSPPATKPRRKASTAAAPAPKSAATSATAAAATSEATPAPAAKAKTRAKPSLQQAVERAVFKARDAVESDNAGSADSSPGLLMRAGSAIATGTRMAGELRRWTATALNLAGQVSDISLQLASAAARDPKAKAALEQAGDVLRSARESTGMTLTEVSQAINLQDPELLDRAEHGKASLPLEVILRLAGVLGRHDPVPFAIKLLRSYAPELGQTLDDMGIGKLLEHVGRERELVNLYRGSDEARKLNDADFADVLAFTKQAFEMAVRFRLSGKGEPDWQ